MEHADRRSNRVPARRRATPIAPDAHGLAPRSTQIGEDFEGNVVTFEIDDNGDHTSASCPAPMPCVNGPHVRDGFGFITHGFVAPLNGAYSSTLVSEDGNARTFACVVTSASFNCQGQGTFPGVGATFRQACAFGATTGGCRLLHF